MARTGRPTEELLPVTEAVRVRLTAPEKAALADLAKRRGTTCARLVRRAVREMVGAGPDLFDDGLVELSEAAREIAAVGRNLNQVAARLNSGDYAYPSDVLGAVRDVALITTRLQDRYRALIRRARLRWVSVIADETV